MPARRMIITDACEKPSEPKYWGNVDAVLAKILECPKCNTGGSRKLGKYPDMKTLSDRAAEKLSFKEAKWPWNGQGGVYTTEASDLKDRAELCPNCGERFSHLKMVTERNNEGEITHWAVLCGCGAKLTIFND
jgi:ribosomal protein S27AE